jgi:hypothetical protein
MDEKGRMYRKGGADHGPSLADAVRLWPTPTTPAGHCTGRLDEWGGSGNPFRVTEEGEGSLNADWVEALMGFPPGWSRTDGGPDGKTGSRA